MPPLEKCSQCDRPAIVEYGGNPLCVSHHLMMQQALYQLVTMLAAHGNEIAEHIEAGIGYIMRVPRTNLPPVPSMGGNFTLNNINVTNSTVGAINTGTLQNLDARVTLTRSEGNTELATALQEFTQALLGSQELDPQAKNESAEQLDFLMGQVSAEPKQRSSGLAKSALKGIRPLLESAASLVTLWDKLAPLIEKAPFGPA